MEAKSLNNSSNTALIKGDIIDSCLVCEKVLDEETIKHGNGTCSEYCNAKYSGYPMPSDYSVGLQVLVDNCAQLTIYSTKQAKH